MLKIAPTLQVMMGRMKPEDKVWVIIFLGFNRDSRNLEDALGIDAPQDRTEYRQRLIEAHKAEIIKQLELTFHELQKIVGVANTKTTYLNQTMICQATKEQIEKIAQIKEVKSIVDDAQFSAEMLL